MSDLNKIDRKFQELILSVSQQGSCNEEINFTHELANIRSKFFESWNHKIKKRNHYKLWSPKDTLTVITDYNKGIPIKQLAEKLGRSDSAIECKIEKLRFEMLVAAFDNLFKDIAVIFQIPYRRLQNQIEVLLDDTIIETLKKSRKN